MSVSKFLSTRIPLPSLEEQQNYLKKIVTLRKRQRELEEAMEMEVSKFNESIFES